MSYKIKTTPVFERRFKRLIKKFPSLKCDLKELIAFLKTNPFYGIHIGNKCYKIRLNIRDKRKGKSGGARVITHVIIMEEVVYLLTIYDKSDTENVTDREILELVRKISI
ncbi:MAG TPA: hypothetical protein ENN08_08140 [Bacteroidales bacterium]|nr:hypothetical protein [Bacteroidales bacterium]